MVNLAIINSGDDFIHLSSNDINPPIYAEHVDPDLNDVIYKAFIDNEGIVMFGVGNTLEDYDISVDGMEMDLVLHLIGEFEWLELLFRNKVK